MKNKRSLQIFTTQFDYCLLQVVADSNHSPNDALVYWSTTYLDTWPRLVFVNSGNTMNESFQRTDYVFRIDQVNIVTKNVLESGIYVGKMTWKKNGLEHS